jgi:hypothetical protein
MPDNEMGRLDIELVGDDVTDDGGVLDEVGDIGVGTTSG